MGTLSADPRNRGGGPQELTIISESGLYHAILKSRRKEAKPFRRWVTEEVLPTIRRTGSYRALEGSTGRFPPQSISGATKSHPIGWRTSSERRHAAVHRIIARSHKRLANEVGVWAARTFKNYREDLEDGGLETGSSPEVDFTEKAAAEEADDPVTATEESGVWSGLPSVFDCHSSSIRTWGRTSSRVTCRHLGASRNRRRFHQPINVACLVPSRCVPAMPDALICSATCAASVFSGRRAPKFIPVQVRRKVQHLKG